MAGLSLGGINLDVQGLVSQLMEIESRPLQRLQAKESEYQSQLSGFGRLKSAMSAFQTSMSNLGSLDKFETYKVSTSESSDDQSFRATVDDEAATGTFSIDVQNLARSNKFGSTTAFSDLTSTINASSSNLDIDDGTNSFSLDIQGMSLSQIRDSINSTAESDDVGVSASIIQEGSGAYQLVLTASETGLDNKISVTGTAATDLDLTEKQTALDAKVLVDNAYTIESSSNSITDAISGVSLELLKPSTSAADLTIQRDIDAAKESVGNFVSAFNTLHGTIGALKTSGLEGDSVLNSILSTIRSEFNSSAGLSGSFNYLSEIGVTSNSKTGDLELDSDKLEDAIAQDYEAIAHLFANDDKGIAFRLEEKMDEYLKFDGLIKSREEGIKLRINNNEDSQDRTLYRLEQIEARLLKQFGDLDNLISQSNSTSSYLSQQLANLPGFTSK
ncbi:MAG: flagellar filament capping protein FliD [Gammaproteobacteria bacterium]|nr:flagellar filament capping protein FliD [Gammaproteobacteria bacterium]